MLKLKKILSLCLLSVIVLTVSISCADTEKPAEGTTESTAAVTDTAVETTVNEYADDLGEFNYNEEPFTLWLSNNPTAHNDYFPAEENDTSSFDSELYNTKLKIEERFNITLVEVDQPEYDVGPFKNVMNANEYAFDIGMVLALDAATTFWAGDMIYNVENIPHIDLDKPYWNAHMNETMSIQKRTFLPTGAFNISVLDKAHIVAFAKSLVTDLSLESPYDLVKSGAWTFDKMSEMMMAVRYDVNGDGVMNAMDRWGYVATAKQVLPNFWISANCMSIGKDEEGTPCLSINDEKFIDVFNSIFTMMYDDGGWCKSYSNDNIPSNAVAMLTENRSLFFDSTFYAIQNFRDVDNDFGIIPYPKYTAEQTNYYTRIESFYPVIVPKTLNDEQLDRVGVMLEALNSLYAQNVIPQYYEVVLKNKYARDVESADMLDIIYEGFTADIGDAILHGSIRDGIFADMFLSNNRNLSSKAAAIETAFNKNIKSMLDSSAWDY